MKLLIAVLISVFLLLSGQLSASQIEDELAREWKNKVVIVRALPTEHRVAYYKDGKPLTPIHRGYWTSDGMVQITDVAVNANSLRMSGKRVLNWFDIKSGRFRNEVTKQDFELEVSLDSASTTADEVRPLLERLLSRDPHDLTVAAPDYWQLCLQGTHRAAKK